MKRRREERTPKGKGEGRKKGGRRGGWRGAARKVRNCGGIEKRFRKKKKEKEERRKNSPLPRGSIPS